ncbi:MAG: LuxR C-terminal-related transcriptional regulator [Treponema sp.]|nr:LuxR C-terminal-related transcriptional regulator [Treponema sp.]
MVYQKGEKKTVKIWRIFAITGCIALSLSLFRQIVFHCSYVLPSRKNIFSSEVLLILNAAGCAAFLYLSFHPLKFKVYGAVSFLYSVVFLVDGRNSALGVILYFLFVITLYEEGLLKKNTKLKIVCILLLFAALLSTEIRYGRKQFLDALLNKSDYLLVFCIALFLMTEKVQKKKHVRQQILDLTQYPDLTGREKEWIGLVLRGAKYSYIARQYNLQTGTVKNDMHILFDKLDVPDRIGLLARYSGCKIISTENIETEARGDTLPIKLK